MPLSPRRAPSWGYDYVRRRSGLALARKSLRRHRYADFYRRARALGAALQRLGLRKGERVATLCWNYHAHLECYFGIPAAGAHPAVAEAAVIAIAHEKWGERPLACVVLKEGRHATPEEFDALLARHFAKWQLPDRYDFIAEIPRTSTGTFWKAKLRSRYR